MRSGEGMVTGDSKCLAGRQADQRGGGSGGGLTPGRRTINGVQGGDRRCQGGSDRGRSQDEDRRALE